jgi:hypothetical protein
MKRVTIEADGVTVTVGYEGPTWPLLQAAIEAIQSLSRPVEGGAEGSSASMPFPNGSTPSCQGPDTTAERQRDVVIAVLADGHAHERRELSQAVRKAGLKARGLDSALKLGGRFAKSETVEGRPTYRDTSVPVPWGKLTSEGVPTWGPPDAPGEPVDLGTLGNGSSGG